ncbi:MAG: glycosyl transferase family 1 [Deltaproteobacteria bacterium HGW-Deltaproteobacteria-13]|jgi:glycosyltransferase involved in cell wall biosynthesis|nr:MAG: glycosyl transferase family 1 [Deltaproteobacteria bacterium HGW-Deltaproteobacteria-13]
MQKNSDQRKAIRLHFTNVAGLGAVRLLQSLLPSMINQRNYRIEAAYIPIRGELSNYVQFEQGTMLIPYKRYLPNSISRLLECTLFGSKFNGKTPLLIFGDIPIRGKSKQTVFVQTPLLTGEAGKDRKLGAIKYLIARWLFRRNIRYASDFIVQTEAMKSALIDSYPEIKNRIHIIPQPPPNWLIRSEIKRTKFINPSDSGMQLFYPAAFYPHKNHRILKKINRSLSWPVSELILTIPNNLNPNPSIPWIHCLDRLEPDAILNYYRTSDALLFLSLSESLGFPLVEAMWIGLPIICPDLPYARILCGEEAIYFDPQNVDSLNAAIVDLNQRRQSGWWPDWSKNLEKIPHGWPEVADEILELAAGEKMLD